MSLISYSQMNSHIMKSLRNHFQFCEITFTLQDTHHSSTSHVRPPLRAPMPRPDPTALPRPDRTLAPLDLALCLSRTPPLPRLARSPCPLAPSPSPLLLLALALARPFSPLACQQARNESFRTHPRRGRTLPDGRPPLSQRCQQGWRGSESST